MKAINYIIMVTLMTIGLTSCGPRYTPEQIAQMQEQRMKLMQQYQSQMLASRQVQQSQPQQVQQPKKEAVTEQGLFNQIAAVPALEKGTGVLFKRAEDGFTANGERFIDFEGEITAYAFDGLTGDVTYLAEVDETHSIIKFVRATIPSEPIKIADVVRNRGSWKVQTVTGKNIAGSVLRMTSKGFVIVRNNTAFLYEPGKGVKSIAAPSGFSIAAYQTGDIASTRYILVEKIPDKEGSFGGLWSATKALGGAFGGEGNQDYALLNIDTKKVVPLFIGYTGDKQRYTYHGQGVKTKNSGHYYWRTEWFKVDSGVYVVYVVNGIRSAKVIHLDTGLEKTIFERALGISSVVSYIQKNGKIKVVADMGFGNEAIDDLEAFMLKDDNAVQ